MSLDQNLMGLGMPAALAVRIATAGTGPIAITAKGSSTTTAAQLGSRQNFAVVGGSGWISLPIIGGSDSAPEIGDDFIIHNNTGTTITVGITNGATVSINGAAQTASFTIGPHANTTLWVASATQWVAQIG